jgi:hypothetical protein
METILYLALIMLLALMSYLKWHAYVSSKHVHMTPEQINASGNYFKKVLPYINITEILKCVGLLPKKNKGSSG